MDIERQRHGRHLTETEESRTERESAPVPSQALPAKAADYPGRALEGRLPELLTLDRRKRPGECSILGEVLGSDFDRLHPRIAERYAVSSSGGQYAEGRGIMERVWNGSPLFRPFLVIGAARNVMFPECGANVPFAIQNWAYRDTFGRETLTLNRTFELPSKKLRRFDEFLVLDPRASQLLIYVGSHQHLVVEIHPRVTAEGGLELRTGAQRLLTRTVSPRFPLLLSAEAHIREWYDARADCLRIDGRVRNRLLGDVFCCVGSFQSAIVPVPPEGIPGAVRPVREDRRW